MAVFTIRLLAVHNWHDAAMLIVLLWAICIPVALLTLAARITYISLRKREAQFTFKR